MPRIREIGSQVGVSGAVGGRAASAQDFGASIGQAVEGFGQVLEGASDAIQKRVKQSEYSDYYASHAEKQAEWIELVTYMGIIGGGLPAYIGYFGFLRDKQWGLFAKQEIYTELY